MTEEHDHDQTLVNIKPRKVVGVTVGKLCGGSFKPQLDAIVSEQVKIIDDEISSCHNIGSPIAVYDIPYQYDIPGLNNNDAFIYVMSELIEIYSKPESLGGKGFSVNVNFKDHQIKIEIPSIKEDLELAKRMKIISGVQVKPKAPIKI